MGRHAGIVAQQGSMLHGSGHGPTIPRVSDPISQRPTRIRIDLDAISHNLRTIRERVEVPVMAIIKANAYGHGLLPVARHLQAQGVDQLGVAFVEEGIALRRAGITIPILVLGGMFGPQE